MYYSGCRRSRVKALYMYKFTRIRFCTMEACSSALPLPHLFYQVLANHWDLIVVHWPLSTKNIEFGPWLEEVAATWVQQPIKTYSNTIQHPVQIIHTMQSISRTRPLMYEVFQHSSPFSRIHSQRSNMQSMSSRRREALQGSPSERSVARLFMIRNTFFRAQ